MKLLLDTHAFLWFALGDTNLSAAAKLLIDDPANEKLISPAVYWELAIKISVGKYVLHQPYEDFLRDNQGQYRRQRVYHPSSPLAAHRTANEHAVSPSRPFRPRHDRAGPGGTNADREQRRTF